MKPIKGNLYEAEQRREEWQEVKAEVKRAALCPDYLDRAPRGKTYICPFCGSGTGEHGTGLIYYPKTNTVACFANCKEPGKKSKKYDVIDLYAVRFGVDTATAIRDLAKLHNIPLPGENSPAAAARVPVREKHETVRKTPEKAQNNAQEAPKRDYTEYFRECAARLGDPAALAYLEKRGISKYTAERFGLGFDPEADPANRPGAAQGERKPHPAPRVIVPQGKYCFVGRRTDGNPDFAKINAKDGEAGLTYEEEALLNNDGGHIFITEGAFDALAIMEAAPVYAIALNSTGNAGAFIRVLEALPDLPKWKKTGEPVPFIVCMDNDNAGQEVVAYLLQELRRLGAPCIASTLGALPGEDPNDILTKYGRDEMARRIWAATEEADKAKKDPNPEEIPNPFTLPEEDIDAIIDADIETAEELAKTDSEFKRELDEAAADFSEKEDASGADPGEQAPEEPEKDPLDAFLEEIQTTQFEPISTGIKDIDRALYGGFLRRTLVTLAAAPGAGKTALAQWIFENMAAAGHDVLYINLEMDRAQLLARSISRLAWKRSGGKGTSLSALEILRGYEWKDIPARAEKILGAAKEYRERIAPRFRYNPDSLQGIVNEMRGNDIRRIIKAMKDEVDRVKGEGRPEPIFCIDYLQIIEAPGNTTAEQIQAIIKALKDFAIENNTVVFLISAQNRAANKAGISEMESGRDTSAIEYSGDLMLGLVYTAIENGETWTYYERDEEGQILKDRNGTPKKVTKAYDLDRIRELLRKAYDSHEAPDPVCSRLTLKVLKNRFGAAERRANFIFDGEHGTFHQVEREGRPDPEPEDKRNEWEQSNLSELLAEDPGVTAAF